jgi:hypothetical protein
VGQVLAESLEEIVALLVSTGEDATRLRQTSPFTDMLTSEERVVIYEAFQPPGGKRVSIDKMSR